MARERRTSTNGGGTATWARRRCPVAGAGQPTDRASPSASPAAPSWRPTPPPPAPAPRTRSRPPTRRGLALPARGPPHRQLRRSQPRRTRTLVRRRTLRGSVHLKHHRRLVPPVPTSRPRPRLRRRTAKCRPGRPAVSGLTRRPGPWANRDGATGGRCSGRQLRWPAAKRHRPIPKQRARRHRTIQVPLRGAERPPHRHPRPDRPSSSWRLALCRTPGASPRPNLADPHLR